MQFWSEELAEIAQTTADECTLHPSSGPHIEPEIHILRNIGQNLQVLTDCNEETNITQIIDEWFQQRFDYDFIARTCYQDETCINYYQVRELVTTNCMY